MQHPTLQPQQQWFAQWGVTNAQTTAMMANARAAYQQAAAQKASMIASSGAIGFHGGPVGLGITVATVAASYLLMRNNTAEATAKLAEQAKVADQTAESLKKLTGNDRKKAIEDATASFDAQNKKIRESELAVGSALIAIQNYAKGNVEVTNISNQARLGTISYSDAIIKLGAVVD